MMEKVSPDLPPLHSPHLVGAGPSADTSSALLLGFYLWGQDGQCATETETRDQIASPSWTYQRRTLSARLTAGEEKKSFGFKNLKGIRGQKRQRGGLRK